MARSSPRRRRRPNFILIAVVLSAAVIGANALASSRTNSPARRLAQRAYLDELRPEIEKSNEHGKDIVDLRNNAFKLGREDIRQRIKDASKATKSALNQVRANEAPQSMRSAEALIIATMTIRARAAENMEKALEQGLSTGPIQEPVSTLVEVGESLAVADSNYELFLDSLPEGIRTSAGMPASRWLDDPLSWNEAEMQVLVNNLRTNRETAPQHNLAVIRTTTEPPAVEVEQSGDKALILPTSTTLTVTIVVANLGNETESNVTVSVKVDSPGGTPDSARDFVTLEPGQSQSLQFKGLQVTPSKSIRLVSSIEPVTDESSTDDNERQLTIKMR